MKEIVLIKLGGSVITQKDKDYTFLPEVVKRLASEIRKANLPVVIAHGSGSFGHTSALKHGGIKGYKSKWGVAKVARDAMEINRLVMDVLINEKIPAISFRPMSMIVTNNGQVSRKFFEPILEALNQDLTPVIYGDVIWDKSLKSTIYSGEKTLGLISEFLINNNFKVSKIIEVGITDGVYDLKNKLILKINKQNVEDIRKNIHNVDNDVTGGMMHKIDEGLRLTEKGIRTIIINGLKKNLLYNAILGKEIKATILE